MSRRVAPKSQGASSADGATEDTSSTSDSRIETLVDDMKFLKEELKKRDDDLKKRDDDLKKRDEELQKKNAHIEELLLKMSLRDSSSSAAHAVADSAVAPLTDAHASGGAPAPPPAPIVYDEDISKSTVSTEALKEDACETPVSTGELLSDFGFSFASLAPLAPCMLDVVTIVELQS